MNRPASTVTPEVIAGLPKVLLHDHLDGGLRPSTLVELADAVGHPLPTTDPAGLAAWYVAAASSGSLELYLETFVHTTAVTQRADHLRRVATEAVLDLAADGVVYAEQRYAPEQHQAEGLSLQAVVDAVGEGLAEGVLQAARGGHRIQVHQVLTAMRTADRGLEIAELAVANRRRGVVGFDIAGPEAGFPPSRHKAALRALRRASFPATIHAGEGAGSESIAAALQLGAVRLGHGVRIVDDITFGEPTPLDPLGLDDAVLGDLAHWVRDQQVPLEVCPTSNVHTRLAASVATHPVTALARLGFAVTVSTDNRLMSGTTLSQELQSLVDEAAWTLDDLRDVALTAAWNGFIHHDERQQLVDDQILPGYAGQQTGRHRA
ncbi:MAG TPA: adenosine deaminase [Actinotalea sp.]|nr:adenosine deaminase [Actinotalea sp.]